MQPSLQFGIQKCSFAFNFLSVAKFTNRNQITNLALFYLHLLKRVWLGKCHNFICNRKCNTMQLCQRKKYEIARIDDILFGLAFSWWQWIKVRGFYHQWHLIVKRYFELFRFSLKHILLKLFITFGLPIKKRF